MAREREANGKAAGAKRGLLFGVRPNVLVLGAVSLFTDISSEMVYVILPLFLVNVVGAPVMAVGLIEGVAETTASLLKVVSGWWSDRAGRRKPLIFVGYAVSNVVKPLLALTTVWPQVLIIRFADRVGKGVRTAPRDAVIADSCDDQTRGRSFGLHRALDTAGAAIGPLVAFGVLAFFRQDYQLVFILSAIPGLLSLAVIVLFLRDTGRTVCALPASTRQAWSRQLAADVRGLGRPFLLFSVVAGLFALGNSSDAFLILRAQDLGVSVALVPLVYFTFNIVHAALAVPAGIVSDRVGRGRMLVAGYVLFAIIYAGFAVAQEAVAVWVLFAAYGAYYALTDGVQRAHVGDLVPQGRRGSAMGVFNAAVGIAALPASVIGGLLWDSINPSATFCYGSAMALVAAVLLLALKPQPRVA